ncbi:MAG: hypothetical protein ACREP9_19140 [Candidatus Dormibacteraceae bacterium]
MQLPAQRTRLGRTILGAFAALAMAGAWQMAAGDVRTLYPRMAPIDQYLMDRHAEIALARSGAPEAISQEATVLVLARDGYQTAVRGKNGFVCMVERGWVGALDSPEMWNPKIRGADCLNPPAARSILPLALLRTRMLLAGHTRAEVIAAIREALGKSDLPPLEPGAMSYMMSKDSYLTDADGHNGPHLMFFMPVAEGVVWGADLPGSPVASVPYWFGFGKGPASQEASGLPPVRVFTVAVRKWSDGTPAAGHMH